MNIINILYLPGINAYQVSTHSDDHSDLIFYRYVVLRDLLHAMTADGWNKPQMDIALTSLNAIQRWRRSGVGTDV